MYEKTYESGYMYKRALLMPLMNQRPQPIQVLLKDASIAVKDHVGTQEVSWRLRLAERL